MIDERYLSFWTARGNISPFVNEVIFSICEICQTCIKSPFRLAAISNNLPRWITFELTIKQLGTLNNMY